MTKISKKIDELSTTFFELPLVKDYFHAVDLINGDQALLDLSERVKKLQRMMTLHMKKPELYHQYKLDYEAALSEYNQHPYMVNYTTLKTQVEDLLAQMKQIIEI